MGMNFVFENSIEKAMYKKSELTISDEIDYFIGEIKEYIDVISKGSGDVLLSIDPYDYSVLSKEQVEKLLVLGKSLLDEELIEHIKYLKLFKRHNIGEKEFIDFANKMINVCSKAIKENKTIVSLGD
ncbi:hypothetical protein HF520_01270 [Romboutsia sp. CE17]|uniref:hypothetical protein n=1 Tax=Romboutsia sp. CE17 TaxID=2724150 RepID=UPI001442B6DE|nr:hypothetical protein [Romboutsia sp. CE17]QJA07658.1 hypothetical protein HF520_01270 [Romboutsia sp. CE17]